MWTSNKNMQCLPAACFLFNEFWPVEQNVKILGYERPTFKLPDNFEFISMGTQRGPKFWSNDMLDYYSSCSDNYIYPIWEDTFIVKPVDLKFLDIFEHVAKTDKDFFKFNLTADVSSRPHNIIKPGDTADLIEAAQTSDYRLSTQHCIWDREIFLSKLKVNQTPWDFELNDSDSRNDGLNIYATKRNYAVYMGHLYKNGKKRAQWSDCVYGTNGNCTHNIAGLDPKYIKFIEENNWVPEI